MNLLDVNVLLALFDATHDDHSRAHGWMAEHKTETWASCAVVEKGFIRIACSPAYPNLDVNPAEAALALRAHQAAAGNLYRFLPCDISLTDPAVFDLTPLFSGKHTTDVYLAGVAHSHGARLVTFDKSVPWQAVRGATEELVELITS